MKNHILKLILFLISTLFSSCISIGLNKSPEPAKDIKFDNPKSPFESVKSKTGDKVWMSTNSGNSISYISDCSQQSDPSLNSLESDALSGVENLKILESIDFNYNQRFAKSTIAQGTLDGIAIKIKIISFKKNNCNYNLLYTGVADKFDKEITYFDKFKESFVAP